ncbi:Uncharacterised protein [Chlamydia abortus]|uniref:Lipoprotein n=1 Tax=Paenibacillus residui TaxID=629724 RepID=A0ABW3DB02_9BACL|nr:MULTISPECIES: hypothetical protein [Paenibacillaceae]SHE13556.1 Uncharacterised protein [Chlamydia abortus]
MSIKRKKLGLIVALMLSIALIVAGCGKKPSPKSAIETGLTNTMNMKSGAFEMGMTMSMDFPEEVLNANPEMAMVSEMLKNADIKASGVFKQDPQQIEMTLEMNLKGDMEMKFSIPFVLTQDKMWVKIPNIPMMPLPQELVGKFVEMDMKELSEQAGEEFNPELLNFKKQQEFSQDALKALLGSFDEQNHFQLLKKDEAQLPEGIEAKNVVKFTITDENLEEAVKTIVEKAAPQIIDLIASEKYAGMFQISKEELDTAKKDLESTDAGKLKEAIDEMRKSLKINEFSILTAVNKQDFVNYQAINLDVDVKDEDMNFKLGLKGDVKYTNINEEVEFKIGVPTDAVKLEEFIEKMDSLYGGADVYYDEDELTGELGMEGLEGIDWEALQGFDFENMTDEEWEEFLSALESQGIDPDQFVEMMEAAAAQ